MKSERPEITKLNFSQTLKNLMVYAEEEDLEIEKEKQETIRKNYLEKHYMSESSGVPLRYWSESLSTFKATNDQMKRNLETVKLYASQKGSKTLMLCGNNGTGKTHLGCAIIRERGGIYKTMQRLLFEIDCTMNYNSKLTNLNLLDELCNTQLLVLDEIGRGGRESKQQELCYYIINERYNNKLSTVLISNLPKADFVHFLGKAINDRLNETGIFLELSGNSYRKEKRKEVFL